MPWPDRSIAFAALLAGTLAAFPALAAGVTELTLYSLGQHSNDGNFASTPLVADAEGNLFGGTIFGGTDGKGTIFEVSPPTTAAGTWTEQVLHSFAGDTDGSDPAGGLALDPSGNLYGTTFNPGTGGGSVFELVRPTNGTKWTKRVLHQFSGSDGSNPTGTLLRDKAGNLYGVTFSGGSNSLGSVYRLSPKPAPSTAYTFTELYSFDPSTDGFAPYAGVVADVNGNLYGATSFGGPSGSTGVAYRLNRPASPQGTWTLTMLHAFGANEDGKGPTAAMLIDSAGTLYGTTPSGGSKGKGTVFEITQPTSAGGKWGYRVILEFDGANGSGPGNGALVADSKGSLYGTTSGGGSIGFGAVYKLAQPATAGGHFVPSVVFPFGGFSTPGAFPGHGVIIDAKGNLYGTLMGGKYNGGVVFEITP